jgi:drug/metabolite transporter (DMT)-like permease
MPTGELAALGTALCWAVTGLYFAEAARRIGALRVNLLRLPTALVFLSAALIVTQASFSALNGSRAAYLAASAVLGLVVGDLALFSALIRIGPRLASLLMSLAPLFAALAGFLILHEQPGPRAVLGMAVTLAGVAWVVAERPETGLAPRDHGRSLALAVLAAACQGIGLVLAKLGMAGEVPPLTATWVRMMVATATIWALAAATRRLRGIGILSAARQAAGPVIGGAFFGPFVGVWLSLVAARLTDVGVAATLMATAPVLVIPMVAVTDRYRPTWRAIIGTLIAVAGVALLFAR